MRTAQATDLAAALAAQHGWVLTELTPLQVSLEDAYMKLTQGDAEFVAPELTAAIR